MCKEHARGMEGVQGGMCARCLGVQGGVQWDMQGMWRVCKEHLGCAKLVESVQGLCKGCARHI